MLTAENNDSREAGKLNSALVVVEKGLVRSVCAHTVRDTVKSTIAGGFPSGAHTSTRQKENLVVTWSKLIRALSLSYPG